MNTLEQRLKAALDARAQTFDASPRAWLDVQRRTRLPRGRGRWLLAAIPVIAIALIVPVLVNGGLGRTTAGDTDELYRKLMQGLTPASEQVLVDNPAEGRPLRLWMARTKTGDPEFCSMVEQAKDEPYGSCYAPIRMAEERSGWYEGTTRTDTSPSYVDYGLASTDVAKVTAVTDDGRRIDGTVHAFANAPWSIWTVTLNARDQVKTVEFVDGKGRPGMSEAPTSLRHESRRGRPTGMPLALPGGLVMQPYDYDVEGGRLFLFRQGKELGFMSLDKQWLFKDMDGQKDSPLNLYIDQDVAWGVAKLGTARVEITFGTGTPLTLQARPDPWNLGLAIFTGPTYFPADFIPDWSQGVRQAGYDADGKLLWRKDLPARPDRKDDEMYGAPIGEVMTVPGTDDFTGGPVKLWFTTIKLEKGKFLCSSGGNAGTGCSPLESRHDMRSGPGWRDSYLPPPGSRLSYGPAADDLESADAVTEDGRRIPATITRPKDTPTALWYVRTPLNERVAAFAFRHKGRQLEEVWLESQHWCWDDKRPIAAGGPLGDGLVANLFDGPCLKFQRDGKEQPRAFEALPGGKLSGLLALGEHPLGWAYNKDVWYGFALAGTTRLTVTLPGGGQATADAVPDPWGHGVALFSGKIPEKVGKQGMFWRGMRFTGYGADGSVLWTYEPQEDDF
ncbi:hypothetical protein ACIBHX_04240 [Nonomuraea sp. NPDC050536]|uniref:hypothetical protein n=1 Tax=Nonomuraea sp. NPDC050536 TaxID=3364366 RepID=UPI0037CC79E5